MEEIEKLVSSMFLSLFSCCLAVEIVEVYPFSFLFMKFLSVDI